MDAVCWVALESTDFRYKSTKNHPKALIIQGFYGSGTGGREFESRHFDQKYGESIALPIFLFVVSRLDKFRAAECECANFAGERVKLACKPSTKLFCRRQSPRRPKYQLTSAKSPSLFPIFRAFCSIILKFCNSKLHFL